MWVQTPPTAFDIAIVTQMKKRKMVDLPHPGNAIHIPLPEAEALRLMLEVKPTADMPRPGANPTKAKRKRAKQRKT